MHVGIFAVSQDVQDQLETSGKAVEMNLAYIPFVGKDGDEEEEVEVALMWSIVGAERVPLE